MSLPLAFVDLETTGTTAAFDRITEIGIVRVDETGVNEWHRLVNPGRPIPPMIQSLTGISNEMVRSAPPFADVAAEVAERLQGCLFIAHNARFDYGFLRAEFERVGMPFRPGVLCTVRLSRRLYPEHRRHNLDSLIERHSLVIAEQDRHRALGDAKLVWQFWQSIHGEFPAEHIQGIADVLSARVRLPDYLDPALPDVLPDAHGVYVLYGDQREPLFVGRADNIRSKVLAHFKVAGAPAKAVRMAEQTRHIDWKETGGAIGALLHEMEMVQRLAPRHNRRGRRATDVTADWPYAGAIGIREGHAIHVINNWHFLGTAYQDEGLWALLDSGRPDFDYEVYRILRDRLALLRVVDLSQPPNSDF
ncbi:3'-5' exonuclease family protein [Pigmentiphaga litoralis]|uniref:DNA-directed DNA polymerase n=1 Tax=Pigmentiphaga litoralis TaxID=516702 RepID=A0A7Y9IYE1_9BURK|nr:exonuclease domain-containing protein [Pigmentiphaga litoralis]NYE26272.1 DNA polymerase-3 subunit epsilon [Pigmentiphaga litoralis]NYE85392.1 DNA polymerase-3 subunit epsilon [Pigmentiphaga litoralis]